jgi:hypothetical protein
MKRIRGWLRQPRRSAAKAGQPRDFASSCHKKLFFLAGLTWINRD